MKGVFIFNLSLKLHRTPRQSGGFLIQKSNGYSLIKPFDHKMALQLISLGLLKIYQHYNLPLKMNLL